MAKAHPHKRRAYAVFYLFHFVGYHWMADRLCSEIRISHTPDKNNPVLMYHWVWITYGRNLSIIKKGMN